MFSNAKRMFKVAGNALLILGSMMLARPILAQEAQVQPAAVNAPAAADAVWPGAQFARFEKSCEEHDADWCLTTETQPEHGVDSPVYKHDGLGATFDASGVTQVTLGIGKKNQVCGVLHATDPKFKLDTSWGAHLEWEDKSHKGLSTFPQLVGTGSITITATAPSGAVSVLKVSEITCGNPPPVITETPVITPTITPTETPVITPTITPTETPVITPTITPTETPTPVTPICSSVVWTLSGELVAEGTDATAQITIQNFVPGMTVQIVGMSSTNNDPTVIASSAPVTETMSIPFRAWPGTTSGVMINGQYQPNCENSWPTIVIEEQPYQLFLPLAPNSTETTEPVKYCSIALNLDPQAVNLGESETLPTTMRPVTWTGDIAYVTSTAWEWHPAIVSPDGEVLVWAFLNGFHSQTYISKLALDENKTELPLNSSTLNAIFSLFSEWYPFKDRDGNRHDSLHVQATFDCRSTGLFPTWREELVHGTAQSANVEETYLAIGDAAK